MDSVASAKRHILIWLFARLATMISSTILWWVPLNCCDLSRGA